MKTILLCAALCLLASPVAASNPDGRPSITITLGANHANNFTEASAGGYSATGNKYGANHYGPDLTLRIPNSDNVTFLLGGYYSRYNADMGIVSTTSGSAQVNQKADIYGGSFGVRFYFGSSK